MSEPVVLEPLIQKSDNDCGIACLAMYLGLAYTDVRKAAGRRLKKDGMTTAGIIATGKKLGHELVLHKDFDSDDVGILDLDRATGGHVAIFAKGCVWTTASGQLWTDLHAYGRHHGFTVLGLIQKKEE